MTIEEIYKQYKIMPSLQTHQLRVAAVAQIICDSLQDKQIDTQNVVITCLLHDMGNIIKFKLDLFPEFLEPEGFDYWKGVQQEFFDTYGEDEHVATMMIAKSVLSQHCHSELDSESRIHISGSRIGVWDGKDRILDLLRAIGFFNAKQNYESDDYGRKIAAYADMRVMPMRVTSMKERLKDGRKRFSKMKSYDAVFFDEMSEYLKKIENQIFVKSSLEPGDITNNYVEHIIPKVRSILHTQSSDQKGRQPH